MVQDIGEHLRVLGLRTAMGFRGDSSSLCTERVSRHRSCISRANSPESADRYAGAVRRRNREQQQGDIEVFGCKECAVDGGRGGAQM